MHVIEPTSVNMVIEGILGGVVWLLSCKLNYTQLIFNTFIIYYLTSKRVVVA